MSLTVKPGYDPRTNPEVKLVPIVFTSQGSRGKHVELQVTNDGQSVTVRLNSLEADTIAQGLRTATR